MPLFPSEEWCEEAARLVNADPETALAGRGWTGDIAVVVCAEKGKLQEPFTVHFTPNGGRIEGFTVLEDPDDLDALSPAYVVRGPYSMFKGLIQGTVDPVEAMLRRWILVEGDVQPLIERMRHKGIAERLLAKIGTTFADER